jgi:hypothetical protein
MILGLVTAFGFAVVCAAVLAGHRPLRVGDGVRLPNANPDQGLATEIRGRLRSRTAVVVLRGTGGFITATTPTRTLQRIDASGWDSL